MTNKQGTTKNTEPQFSVRQVMTEGDFGGVHTNLINNKNKPSEEDLRQAPF